MNLNVDGVKTMLANTFYGYKDEFGKHCNPEWCSECIYKTLALCNGELKEDKHE